MCERGRWREAEADTDTHELYTYIIENTQALTRLLKMIRFRIPEISHTLRGITIVRTSKLISRKCTCCNIRFYDMLLIYSLIYSYIICNTILCSDVFRKSPFSMIRGVSFSMKLVRECFGGRGARFPEELLGRPELGRGGGGRWGRDEGGEGEGRENREGERRREGGGEGQTGQEERGTGREI